MKKSAIALTTLALFLGACNDNAAEDAATAAGDTVTDAATATGDTAEGAVVGSSEVIPTKTGPDTLVMQVASDVPTLDPGQSYDTASGELIENMYETLVGYKGSSITELEPLLATDWEMNDDGTEYRFTLRDGVTFHSGNPFTCADAEYTLRRNMVTNNSDSGNWFVAESLLGTSSNANNDDSVTWEAITNAIRCDGETLVLTLPKTDPAFLAKLAYSGQSIVDSQHAKEIGEWDGTEATWKDWVGRELADSALSKDPSGTGAYRLANMDSTDATFKAFENYWGGEPPIKNVVRRIVPEESSRIQAFLNGDADLGNSSSREIIETQIAGQPGIAVIDGIESTSAFGFSMNPTVPEGSPNLGTGEWGSGIPADFFADVNMRRCFTHAMDYQAYIDQYYLGKGEMPNVMMPKSFLGYDESIPAPQLDLEQAEKECKTAHGGEAWEKGFTLPLVIEEHAPPLRIYAEILKTNIEAMNPKFKINIIEKPWSEIVVAKDLPMQRVGWAPDYADPDNFIRTMYYSDGYYAPKSGINDPQLDEWIDEAYSTTDEAKRKELYSKIAQKAADESYYLLMPNPIGITTYHNDLEGRTLETRNPMLGGRWLWKNMSKTQ